MGSGCKEEVIVQLLVAVIGILDQNDEKAWAVRMGKLLAELENSNNKSVVIKSIIQIFLGGAGSLSDVVLHENQMPLIAENNELYELLNQLYDKCKAY